MSSGGGSSGATTTSTIQHADPWSGQQPYLRDVFREAQRLYFGSDPQSLKGDLVPDPGAAPQYYPGATVTPLAAETEQALALQAQRALGGSPLLSAAEDETAKTLSGSYLSAGNPYFSGVVQSIDDALRPQIDARFIGSGRYGSPVHAETAARALAGAVAPFAFRNYADERGNMQRAATAAPGLSQAGYADIAALGDVGARREAQTQAELTDEVNRWNFDQNRDAARLAQYLQMIQGNFGGTTATTQTVDAAQVPSAPTWLQAFQGLLGGSRGLLGIF